MRRDFFGSCNVSSEGGGLWCWLSSWLLASCSRGSPVSALPHLLVLSLVPQQEALAGSGIMSAQEKREKEERGSFLEVQMSKELSPKPPAKPLLPEASSQADSELATGEGGWNALWLTGRSPRLPRVLSQSSHVAVSCFSVRSFPILPVLCFAS